MTAPNKHGLNYFPHDVDMSSDQKIEYLEVDCGVVGYAVYNKLLEKIYRLGYYIKWLERDSKLFAKHLNIDVNVCINSINVCINEGLFCKMLHNNYNILTSKSIQKRYIEANNRRKEIKLYKQFLLLDKKKLINVYNNLVIVDINLVNDDINRVIVVQTKLKETKLKETKLKETKTYMCKFDQFWTKYPKKKAKKDALRAWEKVKFSDDLFEMIMKGLDEAIECEEWNKDKGQFIPLPATWLNGRRWEDKYDIMIKKKPFGQNFINGDNNG